MHHEDSLLQDAACRGSQQTFWETVEGDGVASAAQHFLVQCRKDQTLPEVSVGPLVGFTCTLCQGYSWDCVVVAGQSCILALWTWQSQNLGVFQG